LAHISPSARLVEVFSLFFRSFKKVLDKALLSSGFASWVRKPACLVRFLVPVFPLLHQKEYHIDAIDPMLWIQGPAGQPFILHIITASIIVERARHTEESIPRSHGIGVKQWRNPIRNLTTSAKLSNDMQAPAVENIIDVRQLDFPSRRYLDKSFCKYPKA
jgi:hypothetical protein